MSHDYPACAVFRGGKCTCDESSTPALSDAEIQTLGEIQGGQPTTDTDAGVFEAPSCGWHCFHCGEHFPGTREGKEAAEEHFGPTPDVKPACIERQTSSWPEIMKRYRRALKKNARLAAGDLPKQRKLSAGRTGWLVEELRAWGHARPVSDLAPPENAGQRRAGKTPSTEHASASR